MCSLRVYEFSGLGELRLRAQRDKKQAICELFDHLRQSFYFVFGLSLRNLPSVSA